MVEVVGHKLKTHHPVIEPVSDIRVGNGIFRCGDGGPDPPFCLAETDAEKDELEKARCSRDKCGYRPRSSIPEDWVVVCAVRYEPVSTCNSLLTGKLTGNFKANFVARNHCAAATFYEIPYAN